MLLVTYLATLYVCMLTLTLSLMDKWAVNPLPPVTFYEPVETNSDN